MPSKSELIHYRLQAMLREHSFSDLKYLGVRPDSIGVNQLGIGTRGIDGTIPRKINQTISLLLNENIEPPLNMVTSNIVTAATKNTDRPYNIFSVSFRIFDANIYVIAIQNPLNSENKFPQ